MQEKSINPTKNMFIRVNYTKANNGYFELNFSKFVGQLLYIIKLKS